VLRSSYATNQYIKHKKEVEEKTTEKTTEDFLNSLAAVMNTSRKTLLKHYILINEDEELKGFIDFENELDEGDEEEENEQ
jgi:benzoyl-CoA reductase/2-hydroxyglutaryl-CoA dehydratase subunit BcrC/BadD/HgdB